MLRPCGAFPANKIAAARTRRQAKAWKRTPTAIVLAGSTRFAELPDRLPPQETHGRQRTDPSGSVHDLQCRGPVLSVVLLRVPSRSTRCNLGFGASSNVETWLITTSEKLNQALIPGRAAGASRMAGLKNVLAAVSDNRVLATSDVTAAEAATRSYSCK